jgi:hypothetical protein
MESTLESTPAEIKAWRKALTLGAAGLAGLAPLKAKAGGWESPQSTGIEQTMDIKNRESEIDNKYQNLLDAIKEDPGFQQQWQGLASAYAKAQTPDDREQALRNMDQWLDEFPESTDVPQDDMQLPAFKTGYEAGTTYHRQELDKASQGQLSAEPDLISMSRAQAKRYNYMGRGEETRDFIRGWLKGYIGSQTAETPVEKTPAAVTYSIKPGAIVTRRSEDLLKLKRLSAQGDRAAVRKFYDELILTKAAWEVKQAGDLNIHVSVEPAGNGIVKMQSDKGVSYIAQDDLIPSGSH